MVDPHQSEFRAALDFAASRCRRLIATYPDYYPMYTVGGRWNREGERWTHWCEGFFPGMLWLLYEHTWDPAWRQLAERYTRPLEPRKNDRAVHDLGFLFLSTYLRWYELTRDRELREVLIQAARTLALRRQRGGYLASFVGPQSLFIDIMMNVGLIFWAARETGDQQLWEIALEHCRTTARYLVRPDGGTAHEGIFDVATGAFLHQSTHQGLKPESTWSRGQAWALYGFTKVYRLTGEREFFRIAQRCADYYLDHAPAGLVPRWDFDAPPDSQPPWDSSAGAIAASGLLDLAAPSRERYWKAALTILRTLCSDQFLARDRPDWEGILMHGVYHYPRGLAIDESVAWGEHFFIEALVKIVGEHPTAQA